MFTESRAVIEQRFLELEAHMPPDGEGLQGTAAAEILAPLEDYQLKELAIFGLATVLRGAYPCIPYAQNPDSDECRQELALTYLKWGKFSNSPSAKGIFNLSHETLSEFVGPSIKDYLQQLSDSRVRTIRAIQQEPTSRHWLDERGVRYDALHIDSKRSRESIAYQLSNNMWGASRQLVNELYIAAGGKVERNDAVDPKQFLNIAQKVREVISEQDLHSYIRSLADLSKNHVVVLLTAGRLTEGLGTEDDITIPQIKPGEVHHSTDLEWHAIPVGCPARYVKGMLAWAPNMMLSACQAIASHPPIPTIY